MKRIGIPGRGFTILELMIAISVFSLLLLVCLSTITFVGRLYYKGVTVAKTQEVVRSTADAIADSVRFSNAKIWHVGGSGDWDGAVCIGNKKYSYKTKILLASNPANPNQGTQVLVESTDVACGTVAATAEPVAERSDSPLKELLGENMRLNVFEVVSNGIGSNRVVTVRVSVVYGGVGDATDNEIFNYSVPVPPATSVISSCKTGIASSQFCAVGNLSKTIYAAER